MKHKTWALSLALLLALASPAAALDAEELVPVGSAVGIELEMGGVLVVGLADVETAAGTVRPAADAGIAPGDLILSVNGRETRSAAEFLTAAGALDGKAVTVQYFADCNSFFRSHEVVYTVGSDGSLHGCTVKVASPYAPYGLRD